LPPFDGNGVFEGDGILQWYGPYVLVIGIPSAIVGIVHLTSAVIGFKKVSDCRDAWQSAERRANGGGPANAPQAPQPVAPVQP